MVDLGRLVDSLVVELVEISINLMDNSVDNSVVELVEISIDSVDNFVVDSGGRAGKILRRSGG